MYKTNLEHSLENVLFIDWQLNNFLDYFLQLRNHVNQNSRFYVNE